MPEANTSLRARSRASANANLSLLPVPTFIRASTPSQATWGIMASATTPHAMDEPRRSSTSDLNHCHRGQRVNQVQMVTPEIFRTLAKGPEINVARRVVELEC